MMDLSKFKKVASDKKTATLKHDDGHELKIAIGGLSPKLKKSLEALPIHAAEGTDLEENQPLPEEIDLGIPSSSRATEMAMEGRSAAKEAMHEEAVAAMKEEEDRIPAASLPASKSEAVLKKDIADPKPAAAPTLAPQQKAAPVAAAPAAPALPAQGMAPQGPGLSAVPAMPKAPATPEEQATVARDEALSETQNLDHDLAVGNIKPKTYSDLFAEKSTLGKIGTLFGLLISGAGSGLAGQENMVMKMMNQEIERDIAAQEKNQGKDQNMYRLNFERLMAKANIEQLKQQGKLTNAQAQAAMQSIRQQSWLFTKMQSNSIAAAQLVSLANRYPPGSPERQAADAQLAAMAPHIQTDNFDMATRIGAMQAHNAMLFGTAGGGTSDTEEGIQKRTAGMRMLGPQGETAAKDLESKHIPGVPGKASIPIPQDKRDQITAMNTLDYKVKDLLDFSQKHRGSPNPKVWREGEQKAEELINFYNNSLGAGGGLTSHRLEWLDRQIGKKPANIFSEVLGNNAALREIQKSNQDRKDILLEGLGFSGAKKQAGGGGGETIERLDPKSGKIVVYDAKTKKPLRFK